MQLRISLTVSQILLKLGGAKVIFGGELPLLVPLKSAYTWTCH